jgi:predicted nucleic-acid-binding Zn-ribbon protein
MGILGFGAKDEPETVEVNGVQLVCHVCRHNKFWRTEGQLNTSLATFINLDWTNISAVCLVCDNCGYIHWFLPKKS